MAGGSRLSDNAKLVELAEIFLACATDAVIPTEEEMSAVFSAGLGWTAHGALTFKHTAPVTNALSDLVELVSRKLGPRAAHEDELRRACWGLASAWLSQEEPNEVSSAARRMLADIEAIGEVTADLVLPNFTFRRDPGVPSVHIGPVEILDAEIAKRRVDALDNEHIRFVINGGRGVSWRDGATEASFPNTCWWVKVTAARRNVRDEGTWLVDVAIALARFLHRPWAGLAPGHKDREPAPFEPTPRDLPGVFFVGDTVMTGDFTAPRYYGLDAAAVASLESDEAKAKAAAIFEPIKDSVGGRIALALGWLTRARRAGDRSEALLFYFTALEALLSPGKGEPIAQTIARQVAVMRSDKPAARYRTSELVLELYGLRSNLVHQGERAVLALDVRRMSALTDFVLWRLIHEVDLSAKATLLLTSLRAASFGDPWSPPTPNPAPSALQT